MVPSHIIFQSFQVYHKGLWLVPPYFWYTSMTCPDYVNSAVHLFANDTIMYLTVHNEDHCDQLQADID